MVRLFFLFTIPLLGTITLAQQPQEAPTCEWENDDNCSDKHMVEMTFEGDTFMAYKPPDISTFYKEEPGSRKAKVPKFNGMFGKFVNLSPKDIDVYWDPKNTKKEPVYIASAPRFSAAATATFPNHRFIVKSQKGEELIRWHIINDKPLYLYDPIVEGHMGLDDFSEEEMEQYVRHKRNLEFGKVYHETTGNHWLSLYPLRHQPLHPMWPADYFGQEFTVETAQTHFTTLPPEEDLTVDIHGDRQSPRRLVEFRTPDVETMNMTLKVLSCSPRVYEIQNFLSETEVDHIMELATGSKLKKSSTKAGTSGRDSGVATTRTSRNTWVNRDRSMIIDAIYRRASDLLRVDEKLMRTRRKDESHGLHGEQSFSEHLQLVHYEVGQEYTPHHDFSIPAVVDGQPMRFATVLFYLNEPEKGGETSFPRWLNAETRDRLEVKPETGKAILFYSLLPDGNMDDRSQHAALPVVEGEKWLINLWFWDPFKRFN